VAVDALRIVLGILLDTAVLVIRDIGTRSPLHLFANVRPAFANAGRSFAEHRAALPVPSR
jgi:hypothetical protein